MKIRPISLLSALAFAAVGPKAPVAYALQQLPSQDSVDVVLAHYAEAVGGESLGRLRTETRHGTLVRGFSGQVPLRVVSLDPRKWHWKQSLAWGDQLSYGFDGTHGWVQDSDGVEAMGPRQVLEFQLLFGLKAPLRLREVFPELTLTESERIGDRDAVVLVGRSLDGTTTELAFDRGTGLLLRAGNVMLEDYRDVGMIKRPFRLRIGDMLRVVFTEIRHDLDVDETLFQQPTSPLATQDPVIYRVHDEVEVSIEALEACVGEYQVPSGPILGVFRQGTHLMLQLPNAPRLEIFPLSETSYVMRFNHLEFDFLTDESGGVTHLVLGGDPSRAAEKIR